MQLSVRSIKEDLEEFQEQMASKISDWWIGLGEELQNDLENLEENISYSTNKK